MSFITKTSSEPHDSSSAPLIAEGFLMWGCCCHVCMTFNFSAKLLFVQNTLAWCTLQLANITISSGEIKYI